MLEHRSSHDGGGNSSGNSSSSAAQLDVPPAPTAVPSAPNSPSKSETLDSREHRQRISEDIYNQSLGYRLQHVQNSIPQQRVEGYLREYSSSQGYGPLIASGFSGRPPIFMN